MTMPVDVTTTGRVRDTHVRARRSPYGRRAQTDMAGGSVERSHVGAPEPAGPRWCVRGPGRACRRGEGAGNDNGVCEVRRQVVDSVEVGAGQAAEDRFMRSRPSRCVIGKTSLTTHIVLI